MLDARARPRPGIEPGRRLADRDVLYLCVALATARREVGLSRVRSKETQRTETRAVSRARLSRRPRDAHQTLRTFEPCVRRAEESRDARARPSPGLRGSRGCRASRAALVDVRVDRRFGLGFRAHPTAGAPVGAPIRAPQLENQRHQLEHLRATIRFSPPSIRFTPPFLTFNSGF